MAPFTPRHHFRQPENHILILLLAPRKIAVTARGPARMPGAAFDTF